MRAWLRSLRIRPDVIALLLILVAGCDCRSRHGPAYEQLEADLDAASQAKDAAVVERVRSTVAVASNHVSDPIGLARVATKCATSLAQDENRLEAAYALLERAQWRLMAVPVSS